MSASRGFPPSITTSMDDSFDLTLRAAVYRRFASTGQSPTLDAMCEVSNACAAVATGSGLDSNRLSAQARRPGANEMKQIFARIGLTDRCWDPQGDKF